MKVGILTFHYSCNYGAILQAYALHKVLEQQGHEVSIINCVPTYFKRSWKNYIPLPFAILTFKRLFIKILHGNKLVEPFDEFRKEYLNLTDKIDETQLFSVNDKFDAIITGSDQVWSQNQHFRPIYFINWQPSFQGRRISYAPCCSQNIVLQKNQAILRMALKNFNAISVRNDATYNLVKDTSDIEPLIVADPTALHSFKELICEDDIPQAPYILTYILGADIHGGGANAITALKRIYGNIPVYGIVSAFQNPQILPWADYVLYNATPKQWLNMIAHATCVYTDSFHGAMFSAKFRRPFIAYYESEGRGTRFIDMQKRYAIYSQIITHSDQIDNLNKSDLELTELSESLIDKHVKLSLDYIVNSLL